MIATMAEFSAILADAQARRANEVRCEFTPAMSARTSDAALTEVLVIGLPMAQGVQHRIVRSRGRGAVLTAKVRYRDAVRMLAGDALSADEAAALEAARGIVADILRLDVEERFQWVYDWVCRNVRYVHTAPGQKGYERLVGAAGVLQDGQANCQGFADVLYLLCGLCGVECEYRIGRGERRLHVWNAVCVNGVWREVDASKGARCIAD
jgi:transglutaminase-like putative cysteine protease